MSNDEHPYRDDKQAALEAAEAKISDLLNYIAHLENIGVAAERKLERYRSEKAWWKAPLGFILLPGVPALTATALFLEKCWTLGAIATTVTILCFVLSCMLADARADAKESQR